MILHIRPRDIGFDCRRQVEPIFRKIHETFARYDAFSSFQSRVIRTRSQRNWEFSCF